MAQNDILVKQLTNASSGEMVAGYTPEHAIYDTEGERLDTKLAGLDFGKITRAQNDALQSISEACTSAVTAVRLEQDRIADLFDVIFPIKNNIRIIPNSGMTACEITCMVTERGGEEFEVDNIQLTKKTLGGSEQLIANYANASRLSGQTNIEGNVEEFKVTASKANRTNDTQVIKKYVCAYGASSVATMSDTLFTNLKKVHAVGLKAAPSVTTADSEYIWIVVPEELTINRVVCNGFDVPMDQQYNYTSTHESWQGTYHVYRSSYALGDATWKLMLN